MGNELVSCKEEPSLLYQFFGRTDTPLTVNTMDNELLFSKNDEEIIFAKNYSQSGAATARLPMGSLVGKPLITSQHVDFEEDFVGKKIDDNIIFKFSQLADSVPYVKGKEKLDTSKASIHLGQFKLFFSELLFLTKYIHEATRVLYVGAAMGYHIAKLADLFPTIMFDLWDPGKFSIEPRDNIKIYNKLFRNENAQAYASDKENILFMCDIRTLDIGTLLKKKSNDEINDLIENDMNMQANWIKIINPIYAYLKFRLPWASEKKPTSKYLGGTVYLQPYSPVGTEARLMTNNYTDYVEYNNKEYDEKFAYFNFNIRFKTTYPRWENIFLKHNLSNCWDNALSLYIIDYYLRKIRGITSDNATGELYMEILNYHIKKFGDKYNVIFDKSNYE